MKYAYKIIAALLAIAIIPIFIFTPLVSIRAESLAVQILAFIGQVKHNETIEEIMSQNGGELPSHIGESLSVYDVAFGDINTLAGSIADMVKNYGEGTPNIDLEKLIAPALAFAILGLLVILCAIITAVLAFVAKDNRKVIYSSLAGFGFAFMMPATFKAIAEPFLNQEISIASVMESIWGSLIGEVVNFQMASTFWVIPAMFIVIIVWTVLYNFTLPEEQKKERKLMLGEADE